MTIFLDLFRLNDRFVADQHVAEAGKPPGAESRPRILLVEDTQFFRTLVQGYLQDTGYEVATAENGMQALDKLASARYDLMVSDIEMPEMDGWRLAREVREKLGLRDLPLLALTTLNSERDRQHARECGFDGYEVKVDRESFLASVARLLNRSATAERGVPVHG
jgi:two-component system chemotaxis sensor kinase CheA